MHSRFKRGIWGRVIDRRPGRLDRVALETLTKREKSLAPVRSHFGDLQFLHSMAGRTGESSEERRRRTSGGTRPAFSPTVASATMPAIAEIVRAYDAGRDWAFVRAILEDKIFRLSDSVPAAQPGACFEWRLPKANANGSAEPVVAIKCE